MNLIMNCYLRYFGILLLTFSCTISFAQVSSWYEPGVSISSSIHFTDKLASETSIMMLNSFRLQKKGPLCVNVGLGYAHRSYHLYYNVPPIGHYDGWHSRDAFVLDYGIQLRMTNVKKLRKIMRPYVGLLSQWHFFKLPDIERELYNYLGVKKQYIKLYSYEIGTELVTKKYPHFYFGVRGDLPFTDKSHYESLENGYQYEREEKITVKILIGIRF